MQSRLTGRIAVLCVALLACLLLPAPAFANMGPPSLLIAYGTTLILVTEIVIMGVETPILWRMLHVPLKPALLAAVASNALSAVIGIPIALVVGNSAGLVVQWWVEPFGTMINVASPLFVIFTFFVASFLVELPVVKFITRVGWGRTAAAVAVANAVTHVALLVLLLMLQSGV